MNEKELSSAQKEEVMQKLQQNIAIANIQELVTNSIKICFNKCIIRPGSSVDSTEQKCVNMCADRFLDSWNLISRSYLRRAQEEAAKQ